MKEKNDWIINAAKVMMIIGILMILLWAIGKSFGWIHSPEWVRMVPVIGGAITLGGLGVTSGRVLERVDRLVIDVHQLNKKTESLNIRVVKIENKLTKPA